MVEGWVGGALEKGEHCARAAGSERGWTWRHLTTREHSLRVSRDGARSTPRKRDKDAVACAESVAHSWKKRSTPESR
jgi:hypothetical protein